MFEQLRSKPTFIETMEFLAVVFFVVMILSFVGCTSQTDRMQPYVDEGYEAGLAGIPETACPYGDRGMFRRNWIDGWQAGYLERRDGEQEKARGTEYN